MVAWRYLAVIWILAGTVCAQADPPPNIVIILADDLGYGDVSCYNADSKIRTPHIDRLASQGVRFTDAHSPSAVCTPTRYGILTGRYCWRTWLKSNVVGGYTPPLIEPSRVTIASFLSSHGYRTGCFGKWHLGLGWTRANGFVGTAENAQKHFRGSWQDGDVASGMNVDFSKPVLGGPTALGFDDAFFTAACSTIDGPFCFIRGDHTVGIPDRMMPVDDFGGPDLRPRPGWMVEGFDLTMVDLEFTDEAIAFVTREASEAAGRRFFVYLALSSPHAPWLPPVLVAGTTEEGPRGDLVAVVDHCVGRVADALDRLGLAENTLLIVTSDNGPRHGANGHESSGALRGHKTHAWEGGHRIPFIARWPGQIEGDSTCNQPIELTDLLATSAAILGEPLPLGAGPDSYNILPALLGEAGEEPIREAIVSHSQAGVFAIRQGDWKLIVETAGSGGWVEPAGGGPKAGSPGQLYNLRDDPREQLNRFSEHPEIVERLKQLLERYKAEGRSAPQADGLGCRFGNGVKIGEVTATSAVIWTRLTSARDAESGAVAAAVGAIRLWWWRTGAPDAVMVTDWTTIGPEVDGTHQFGLTALTPATSYTFAVEAQGADALVLDRFEGGFRTAPAPSDAAPVRFVVTTCHDYHRRDAGADGFAVYRVMPALEPDFFVHTGDIVYYDRPDPVARSRAEARHHWNRLYALPSLRDFHRTAPSYFLRDDHDTLKDDCWPGQTHGELTFAQGLAIFDEQNPVADRPYRTVRWGRDLQVWFVEGRRYRSPNTIEDGPGKSIWGTKQYEWFERTLGASDARFKILFSATPVVGPDRTNKRDNHANAAFAYEGERLRALLARHDVTVICGDRHWQYVSVDDDTGVWEFGSGPSADIHAGGWGQSDVRPEHRYLRVKGGFLSGIVTQDGAQDGAGATLELRHHDVAGEVVHRERFER